MVTAWKDDVITIGQQCDEGGQQVCILSRGRARQGVQVRLQSCGYNCCYWAGGVQLVVMVILSQELSTST